MSPLFSIGNTVIDTKRSIAPTVVAVIEGYEIIYVLENDDGDLYLCGESNLIEYNKYWFEK